MIMEKRKVVAGRDRRFPWDLDWNLLRTFMVIVEQGGITPAADVLGRKQPTVSNALQRLERHLERRLIERKPNFFQVTAAGERLYHECVDVFGTVSRLPNLVGETEEEITGHVSIGLASHVISPLLDDLLEQFCRRHPKVDFSMSVAESQEVVNSLLQKRMTLGFCLAEKLDSRLDFRVFYRQFFGFFCGPRHRLFGCRDVPLADLEGEPYVSFQTDHQGGALRAVAKMRAEAGLNNGLKGVSSSLQEVRRMIIAGMGIGPLPVHVVRRDLEDGLLWQLPPYVDLPPVDLYFITNPRARKNRAETAFLGHLLNALETTDMESRTYFLPQWS
jgi:DNA-binding transcriptional LysR family regulator